MFLKPEPLTPARLPNLLRAAEAALRAIPPAFPLDATVAVNPFLGQTQHDLAHTAARLSRVAGVRLMQSRADYAAMVTHGQITDEDLASALAASTSPLKPASLMALRARMAEPSPAPSALPTLAELAAKATGTDWPALISRSIGRWAAGYFDRGQALWSAAPGQDAFAAWRDWATHDLTPEIAGLTGFCAHVAKVPDTAERAILAAAERLNLTDAAAETCFHRLLIDLGGWAQHARWLLWQAELSGSTDTVLIDLLAIRLVWEEALLAQVPTAAWAETVRQHEALITPNPEEVVDAILQEAAERALQRRLAGKLIGKAAPTGRPVLQAAFCIDVRSEVFRRALESQNSGIETLGFAGFFGLPVQHRPFGSDLRQAHLPVLLTPKLAAQDEGFGASEDAARIAARTVRAWGRFRQAAVSSFAFVEAAGPLYGAKLVKDALGAGKEPVARPAPVLETPLTAAEKADTAARILRAMGLTQGLAPLVLLIGHGSHLTNNPHQSAYQCGACGGHSGEVSARLLAGLLNDAETRAALPEHGLTLPADTRFVAALHDTTSDQVTLFDKAPTEVLDWLSKASALTRVERAKRLPGAMAQDLPRRATNWAEVRPEWGLAGCAAFIAAPRAVTRGIDLGGRAFLHSYDWKTDPGFATLELILTAPVVVASWISLQYYGSAVAPSLFGSGNKLIHNVTGGLGVVEGNGGTLRAGLPWQAVHDGSGLAHDPLRLSVLIEAPEAAISAVLSRHDSLRALFDKGWMHLLALQDGKMASRYQPEGWQPV